ncbi:Protein of unknown function [Cotesia congregata]|uniref:Ubiquitin-like protease family profile domain-containing protein n=1 Tax=Cotesia congregata TaxID=51543 RepID=A0A8J2MRB8_COTCN|nr:Protein of unknown function [Cotesia congregata]
MESSKQAQVLRTSKSRNNRGRTSRRYFVADANYEYQQAVDAHFEKLKKRQKNRDAIMKETIEQAECGNWHKYRRDMITASHFGLICRKKPQTSCAGIVKQILYSRSLGNVDSEKEDKENEKRKKKKNTDKEISTKKITIISNESIKIDLSNLLRKKRKNENSIDNHLYNLPKKQMKTADCSKVITDKVTIQRSNDDCKRKVAINSWITIPNSDKIFTDEEILKAIEIIDNLRVNISLSNVISNISSSDSLLNDESIEYFLQILDQNSDNYTHPVLYYSYPHLIVPSKTKRDLQIIGGNQNRHWRCIRFDGTNLFVYDSLSLPLSTEDYDYIRKRFPQVKPNNITFIEVTHQSDTYSCGVYAAAFATTIALGDDPCLYQYSQNSQAMRMHMIKIIEQRKLMLFPTE